MSFYINKNNTNNKIKEKKRKNKEKQDQHVAERKIKRSRSSDSRHAVVQQETSEVISSSELMHAEVLKETLGEKQKFWVATH